MARKRAGRLRRKKSKSVRGRSKRVYVRAHYKRVAGKRVRVKGHFRKKRK